MHPGYHYHSIGCLDPDDIIKIYGADAVRWFILSDSPPDRDIQWSDSGIQGAFKYIQKIWRICEKIKIYKKEIRLRPIDFGGGQ